MYIRSTNQLPIKHTQCVLCKGYMCDTIRNEMDLIPYKFASLIIFLVPYRLDLLLQYVLFVNCVESIGNF